MRKIAVTGHRPNKLYGYNLKNEKWISLGFQMRNFLKDRFVRATIDGEIKNCKVIDINDDNSLLVEVDSTFKSLFMGEVLPL